jgi:flavorubredoxin
MTRFRLVEKDIYYVGASDYKCGKFENHIPIPGGMAYNSYLLVDKKTVLFDTSDASVSDKFLENVEGLLVSLDRKLDYVVVTHMEPDHSSSLKRILEKYVDAKVVYNKKTQTMFKQFFGFTFEEREILVSEGDKLDTGEHVLEFFMAPMVHWPEVMMCYDHGTKSLFSADAFGAFGSLSGNLFDTEVDFNEIVVEDYRRYYSNIVGKYGPQVLKTLEKASKFEIETILPLNGFMLKKEIGKIIGLYSLWAAYKSEKKGVLIVYASMYDHTKSVALSLATELKERGIREIKVCDVSAQDATYLVSESFKYSDIVLASVTHNNNIYITMEEFLLSLISMNIQNRNFYFIENGTWAPVSAKLMKEKLSVLKNCTFSENVLTIKSSYKTEDKESFDILVDEIVTNVGK